MKILVSGQAFQYFQAKNVLVSNCTVRDPTTPSGFSIFFVVNNNQINQLIDKVLNTWTFSLFQVNRGEKSHNFENFPFSGLIVVSCWFFSGFLFPLLQTCICLKSFSFLLPGTYLLFFSLMRVLYYHHANALSHDFPPQKQCCVSPYPRVLEKLGIISLIHTIIQISPSILQRTHNSLLISRNFARNFPESQLHLQNISIFDSNQGP